MRLIEIPPSEEWVRHWINPDAIARIVEYRLHNPEAQPRIRYETRIVFIHGGHTTFGGKAEDLGLPLGKLE